MPGYVDLHSHFLPGVDDGAQTLSESLAICSGLLEIGFGMVVATPHIRAAMFENTKSGLSGAYRAFLAEVAERTDMPETGLAAEYFCNDLFWRLLEEDDLLFYPVADEAESKRAHRGVRARAVLVESPYEKLPVRVEHRFFEMVVRGIHPVLAHPERYFFLHRETEPIDRMLEGGTLALLDIKALVGRHGAKSQRAAERMLDEGVYFAASSDAHHPEDVALVARGIERLESRLGEEECRQLLADNPRRILLGDLG
ncbi:MAG: protein tyrosine phosphatase [Deltaproteobacteria bacterium]|nr:protein tyrosine phosphatase [Deltaproteobacteria bacterium]